MIDISESIATIINFIIMLVVATYFLFKPVQKILNTRENGIKDRLNNAKENEEKANIFKMENEKLLKNSKKQGKSIVEDYKVKAEELYDEIVKGAHEEASVIIDRAKTEANREREKAQDEMTKDVVDLSVLMCSKALEESIDEEKHRRLIKDFITKVGI
ncbi:F0F1 ATP synthase subunit B [Clostridium rectalis]|uniref:F0F1 ATP synthase subunit B n=1 Tax=Clostridium rectalis TaxID=2040295 RepID=UPI000F63DA6C|nr:F0F1 ATP synthase subunit B [Clostridium rectalis]